MLLTIHLKPNAKEAKIIEALDENTIKVSVKAPAVEGKANYALINLLSDEFGVSKSEVEIVRGLKTRMKQVEIHNRTEEEIALKLDELKGLR